MADFRTRWSLVLVLFLCHLRGLCSASTNGFLTQGEVETAAKNNTGLVSMQDRLQLLFPSICFTESQSITAWSFVATRNNDPASIDENVPQLQVWTPNSANSFRRIAAVGDTSILQGSGRLYSYVLSTPIPVSPGDVLGMHVPRTPALLPLYRNVEFGNTGTYYFQGSDSPQELIFTDFFSSGSQLIPLVAVQFASPSTSSPALSSTIALSSSTAMPPSSTPAPPSTSSAVDVSTTPLAVESTSVVQVSSTFQPVVASSSQFVSPSPSNTLTDTIVAETPSETLTQEIGETKATIALTSTTVVSSLLESTPPAPQPSSTTLSADLLPSVSTHESTPPLQAENSTVMVVSAIAGCLFAVMILVLLAVLIALLVMNKQRKKGQKDVTTSILEERESPTNGLVPNHLDNPMYQGVIVNSGSPTITIDVSYDTVGQPTDAQHSSVAYQPVASLELWNDLYTSNKTASQSSLYQEPQTLPLASDSTQEEGHYEMASPYEQPIASPYEQPIASNSVPQATLQELSHYELPSTASNLKSNNKADHQYSTLDREGLYVPSEEERAALGINESSVFDDNSYEEWGKNLSKSEEADKMAFFEQSDIYWKPATQASVLYDQLSTKKYREIKRSEIQIVRHLGSGQFGTVNEGVWHCQWGKQPVAVKMLRVKAVEEEKVKLLQEAAIMGQFVHPNVVRLHGVVTVGEPVMIAIELMTKGDLKNYLRSIRADPSLRSAEDLPARLIKCCRQVAAGMVYLSKKSFVHRDLAARNILVNEHETCKIGDFGMSRDLEDENYYVSHGGKIPVKWTAPEALHYKKYSTASDVWSFGVLMYEIWSLGHKPFEEFSNPVAIKLVESGYRLPPPPGCPRAVYQLIIQCWHPEGANRPTFSSVLSTLSHPVDQLLYWNEGDRAAHQHADWLGGSLEIGQYLYRDLQHTYFSNKAEL